MWLWNNTKRFRANLLGWFDAQKRDLPWRRTHDPYSIWVSEIMLQQTRVAAAIPYFERFLARFPDFRALATAPEESSGVSGKYPVPNKNRRDAFGLNETLILHGNRSSSQDQYAAGQARKMFDCLCTAIDKAAGKMPINGESVRTGPWMRPVGRYCYCSNRSRTDWKERASRRESPCGRSLGPLPPDKAVRRGPVPGG